MFAAWPVYPLFIGLGAAVGIAVAWTRLRRLGAEASAVAMILLAAGGAALVGAKLFSVVERGGMAWWAPFWELTHGFRYPGGVLGLVLVTPLVLRLLPPSVGALRFGDVLAPTVSLSMALVRVGCTLAGCCHGGPTSLPWAISYPSATPAWLAHVERGWVGASSMSSLPVHPLPVYLGVTSLLLGVLLLHRPSRRDGENLCLFLLLDGLTKLGLEQLRLDFRSSLAVAGAGSAFAGAVGGIWLASRPKSRERRVA